MGAYKNDQTTLLNIKPSDTIKGLYRTIEKLEKEIERLKKIIENKNEKTN